ncbi:hypothetical protein JCM10212_000744 [Sporobolomyces blumeae]
MTTLTSYLWSFVAAAPKPEPATPKLIQQVVTGSPTPSVHDRSRFIPPSLRSVNRACRCPLYTNPPPRYVSFDELIPGLVAPDELQYRDMGKVQAKGSFVQCEKGRIGVKLETTLAAAPPSPPSSYCSSPSSTTSSTFFYYSPRSIAHRSRRYAPSLKFGKKKSFDLYPRLRVAVSKPAVCEVVEIGRRIVGRVF